MTSHNVSSMSATTFPSQGIKFKGIYNNSVTGSKFNQTDIKEEWKNTDSKLTDLKSGFHLRSNNDVQSIELQQNSATADSQIFMTYDGQLQQRRLAQDNQHVVSIPSSKKEKNDGQSSPQFNNQSPKRHEGRQSVKKSQDFPNIQVTHFQFAENISSPNHRV